MPEFGHYAIIVVVLVLLFLGNYASQSNIYKTQTIHNH